MTVQVQAGWYSIKTAAAYTSFSTSAIEKAIARDELRSLRVQLRGKRSARRMKREWLDAWIESKAVSES